ncbi:hypothetical protein AGLY_015659, partial [Aphis glycines]
RQFTPWLQNSHQVHDDGRLASASIIILTRVFETELFAHITSQHNNNVSLLSFLPLMPTDTLKCATLPRLFVVVNTILFLNSYLVYYLVFAIQVDTSSAITNERKLAIQSCEDSVVQLYRVLNIRMLQFCYAHKASIPPNIELSESMSANKILIEFFGSTKLNFQVFLVIQNLFIETSKKFSEKSKISLQPYLKIDLVENCFCVNIHVFLLLLDSERSDECIDFTMMCPLFEKEIESSWYFKGSKVNFYFAITQKLIDVNTGNFHQMFILALSVQIVLKVIKKNPKSLVTTFFYKFLKFKFIRNMSKLRKFAILKIWYKVLHKFFFKYLVDKIFLAQSKYLKIAFEIFIFFFINVDKKKFSWDKILKNLIEGANIDKIRQNHVYLPGRRYSRCNTIIRSKQNTVYMTVSMTIQTRYYGISFCHELRIDSIHEDHRNTWQYLNIIYPRLTNHLRSESFFVYNDTYHCIQI